MVLFHLVIYMHLKNWVFFAFYFVYCSVDTEMVENQIPS